MVAGGAGGRIVLGGLEPPGRRSMDRGGYLTNKFLLLLLLDDNFYYYALEILSLSLVDIQSYEKIMLKLILSYSFSFSSLFI